MTTTKALTMTINQKSIHPPVLITIAGPTASNKTKIAIALAQHFNTVILSADSRQFYKELKIGTAAPTAEELATVKHYFAGHLSIHDYYNVSRYEQDVLQLLDELFRKHPIVIMAGGSGLYLDAVCEGIDQLPEPDAALRERINEIYRSQGLVGLQQRLQQLDPEYYEIVDRNNPNRLKRAIEVCLQTGATYTSLRVKKVQPRSFNIIKIGLNLPRAELFDNIHRRTDAMISSGLVEEVRSLLPHRHLNALNTVGYKEIFAFLDGKMTLGEAIDKIKTNTRRYAKRQLTWFQRDTAITWFHPDKVEEMIKFVEGKTQNIQEI
ncbi:MAG TPA: tRNA (adenosine(37)-N6)-dimethylallyltransferase MiaA [Bacteroidales bacterium]|nr:tRNA (adenosine(37)-N6)-dimethylallyltransferase MiaA [Bacteroidales bacterium]